MKNYIDQLKETWAKSGIDADMMMESMIAQWKAMGIDPDVMLQNLSQAPAVFHDTVSAMQDLSDLSDLFEDEELDNPFESWEDDKLHFSVENGATLEDMKAVSCGALLTVINESDLNTLSSGLSAEDAQSILSQHWDINTSSDLIDTIDWLASSGHGSTCDPIWQQLSKHPYTTWEEHADSVLEALDFEDDDLPGASEQIENIIETFPYIIEFLPIATKSSVSLFAWDACRAINLYRWGFDAGMIAEQDAKQNIMNIANALYQQYNSWEQLSLGYIIGTAMWSGDISMVNEVLHAHYLLTTNSQSPWQLIDWK